jgi:diaminopimelate epimerase
MTIPFTKLHGAKNDFLLTPAEAAPAASVSDLSEIAVEICDRYTGVGADGWMLIDRRAGPDFDASIRLFNSDGSEPELSGNGTRCAAALLAEDRPGQTEFRIRTGAGIKRLRLVRREENSFEFEMNMGEIRVISLHSQVQGRDAVLVDAGNPQCAIPVEDFDFDWRALGAAIERDPMFPKRTNVSFIRRAGIRRTGEQAIDVRFWERGAGETNSSGTGSTGAAVAAVARGMVNPPLMVLTPAGPLEIRMEGGGDGSGVDTIYLTGPAEKVAEGIFHRAKIGR